MTKTTIKRRKFEYTEEEMADAFAAFMQANSGLPEIGRFSRVFREIDCQQGRPDFIALSRAKQSFLKGKGISVKLAGSLVLSLLHECVGRTPDYLARHSGLKLQSIRSALAELVLHKYVKCTTSGTYSIARASPLREVEVVAIELKLDRPKRAVFQAQQARAFAQKVLIVVPPDQEKPYDQFAIAMRRWGIGLATFDATTSEFVVCRLPRSGRPRSKQHQAYAMFQLLDDSKC